MLKSNNTSGDYNFVIETEFSNLQRDCNLHFPGENVYIVESMDYYDFLVLIGIFPSKSQARKSNWEKQEIEYGINYFENLGKKKINLYILNINKKREISKEDSQKEKEEDRAFFNELYKESKLKGIPFNSLLPKKSNLIRI